MGDVLNVLHRASHCGVDVDSRSSSFAGPSAHGGIMMRMVRLTLVATLVLLLNITPSSGQPVYNGTLSDNTTHNTAGGTGAVGASSGSFNTAFGFTALTSNTSGTSNTAFGTSTLV